MRVLVTGASGVFGREIMRRLVARGHAVVGLSRRRPAGLLDRAEFVAADIRDADAVARAADGCDAVAHCAWVVGALHDDDQERRINVGGTENAIEALRRAGGRRIVFASSATAYGPQPRTPGGPVGPVVVDEATPLRPHPGHPYARHKAEVEALLASSGLDAVAIRTAVVLGRSIDNRVWSFMAAPVQLVARDRSPATWQVVHADDVGRFFVDACEAGPAGPVNLAAPGTFTTEELARVFGRRLLRTPERVLRRTVQAAWNRRAFDVSPAELDFVLDMPLMDTGRLTQEWRFTCA
ncbi:MAG: NAD-dependent epimerase/dehydratase family protein, partial [Acidimicrobiales bacterium]